MPSSGFRGHLHSQVHIPIHGHTQAHRHTMRIINLLKQQNPLKYFPEWLCYFTLLNSEALGLGWSPVGRGLTWGAGDPGFHPPHCMAWLWWHTPGSVRWRWKDKKFKVIFNNITISAKSGTHETLSQNIYIHTDKHTYIHIAYIHKQDFQNTTNLKINLIPIRLY